MTLRKLMLLYNEYLEFWGLEPQNPDDIIPGEDVI